MAGLNDSMDYKYAKNIESGLGFSVEWILNDKGPAKVPPTTKRDSPTPVDETSLDMAAELMQLFKDASPGGRSAIIEAARLIGNSQSKTTRSSKAQSDN
jgi:hypothetical protein